MVSVMAASGIAEADWYALAKQAWFPNMELYDPATGTTTPAGATFAFMQTLLARGDVQKVPVDDFTYMYKFGDNAARMSRPTISRASRSPTSAGPSIKLHPWCSYRRM